MLFEVRGRFAFPPPDIIFRYVFGQFDTSAEGILSFASPNPNSRFLDFLSRKTGSAADPQNILSRGYSIVTDGGGNIVKDSSSLEIGQTVSIRLAGGSAQADVTAIGKE